MQKGGARLWTAEAGSDPIAIGEALYALECSPDGRRALTVDFSGSLRIWNTQDGAPVATTVARGAGPVVGAAWQPDGARIVTSGADRKLRWWDAGSGLQDGAAVDTTLAQPASLLSFSRDGTRLLAVGSDRQALLWNAVERTPMGVSVKLPDISSLALNQDGTRAVAASLEGSLRWIDTRTWSFEPGAMRGHQDLVRTVAISPDGTRIASVGGAGRSISLWDARADAFPGAPMNAGVSSLIDLSFSPEGSQLVSADETGIRLWDIATRAALSQPFDDGVDRGRAVAFDPGGSRLVSVRYDGRLRWWDRQSGLQLGEAPAIGTVAPAALAFSPDGQRVVLRQGDGISVRDADSGAEVASGNAHSRDDGHIAYSPDGTHIASSAPNEPLRLWDASAKPLGRIDATRGSAIDVFAFAPRRPEVVIAESNGLLRIWDFAAGKAVGEPFGRTVPILGQPQRVERVAYTSDARAIVAGYQGGLRFWDADTGALLGMIEGVQAFAVGTKDDRIALLAGDRLRIFPAPAAWPDELCAVLTRNPSAREWTTWVSSEVDYMCPCPGLPVTIGASPADAPPRCDGAPTRSMLR